MRAIQITITKAISTTSILIGESIINIGSSVVTAQPSSVCHVWQDEGLGVRFVRRRTHTGTDTSSKTSHGTQSLAYRTVRVYNAPRARRLSCGTYYCWSAPNASEEPRMREFYSVYASPETLIFLRKMEVQPDDKKRGVVVCTYKIEHQSSPTSEGRWLIV